MSKVKISAASRLRNEVLNVPNTVLLYGAGNPDRVIRFSRLPDTLVNYRLQKAQEKDPSAKDLATVHTPLNLDIGPDSEAWAAARREAFLQAKRDQPMPDPLQVAPDSKGEWEVGPEDVPVVEMSLLEVASVSTGPVEVVPSAPKRGRPRKEI